MALDSILHWNCPDRSTDAPSTDIHPRPMGQCPSTFAQAYVLAIRVLHPIHRVLGAYVLAILADNAISFSVSDLPLTSRCQTTPTASSRMVSSFMCWYPAPTLLMVFTKSTSVHFVAQEGDSLAFIASFIYGRLTILNWINNSHGTSERTVFVVRTMLFVPLHCTCLCAGRQAPRW